MDDDAQPEERAHSNAAAALRRIAEAIGTTHVERVDRLRLRLALDELCEHRPDLKRTCERAFNLAATLSVVINSAERASMVQKLKDMIYALAKACE